jgi:hypothetical protein
MQIKLTISEIQDLKGLVDRNAGRGGFKSRCTCARLDDDTGEISLRLFITGDQPIRFQLRECIGSNPETPSIKTPEPIGSWFIITYDENRYPDYKRLLIAFRE